MDFVVLGAFGKNSIVICQLCHVRQYVKPSDYTGYDSGYCKQAFIV